MKFSASVLKFSNNGFTLIELLVVVAIMAITGAFTLANYRSFGEDQNLKNSLLDIQSQLRTAQTNATTGVICTNGTWQVEFTNSNTLNQKCSSASSSKTLQLSANITIQTVTGTPNAAFCPAAPPFAKFTVNFTSGTGTLTFLDSQNQVLPQCGSLIVTLKNGKTNNTKSLIIDQGGNVREQ